MKSKQDEHIPSEEFSRVIHEVIKQEGVMVSIKGQRQSPYFSAPPFHPHQIPNKNTALYGALNRYEGLEKESQTKQKIYDMLHDEDYDALKTKALTDGGSFYLLRLIDGVTKQLELTQQHGR